MLRTELHHFLLPKNSLRFCPIRIVFLGIDLSYFELLEDSWKVSVFDVWVSLAVDLSDLFITFLVILVKSF